MILSTFTSGVVEPNSYNVGRVPRLEFDSSLYIGDPRRREYIGNIGF